MSSKRGAFVVVAAGAYAWTAAGFRPFSWPEYAVTALPIVVGIGLAWWLRTAVTARSKARPPGAWAWAVVFGALVAWELAALGGAPREEHPTLSYLVDRLMSTHPGRALVFATWLALGAALVGRIARERAT